MPRKRKYENAEIVKQIFSREFQHIGNMEASILYRFIDFKKKEDRELMRKNIKEMMNIFEDALKELEDK